MDPRPVPVPSEESDRTPANITNDKESSQTYYLNNWKPAMVMTSKLQYRNEQRQ